MNIDKDFIVSDIHKINILKILGDGKYHTPSEMAIALRTNPDTIHRNCNFLELLGLIEIEVRRTKQKVTYISITEKGREELKNISSSE